MFIKNYRKRKKENDITKSRKSRNFYISVDKCLTNQVSLQNKLIVYLKLAYVPLASRGSVFKGARKKADNKDMNLKMK